MLGLSQENKNGCYFLRILRMLERSCIHLCLAVIDLVNYCIVIKANEFSNTKSRKQPDGIIRFFPSKFIYSNQYSMMPID